MNDTRTVRESRGRTEFEALSDLRLSYDQACRKMRRRGPIMRALAYWCRDVPNWWYDPQADQVHAAPRYCAPAWLRHDQPWPAIELAYDHNAEIPF